MPAPFDTITVRGTDHLVEQVKAYAHVIPVHFVLHDSRGRSYLVVPSRERPDLLVALPRITHFAPYRPTPVADVSFCRRGREAHDRGS